MAVALRRYRDHDALEYQYSPERFHTDGDKVRADRAAASKRTYERLKHVKDVRYGRGPLQTLDVFPGPAGGPSFIFIHGGYWRGGDKAANANIADGLVPAGASVFNMNYDLTPNVTLDQIVAQVREGIAWVHAHAHDYGADPKRLTICGSSAGGHLTAMMLATDWSKAPGFDPGAIRSAIPISGVMETRHLPSLALNAEAWHLDADMAARNCPVLNPPRVKCAMLVAVGATESDEFKSMSQDYADVARATGCPVEFMEVKGEGHFSITSQYMHPGSPLLTATLKLMGLA